MTLNMIAFKIKLQYAFFNDHRFISQYEISFLFYICQLYSQIRDESGMHCQQTRNRF